MGVNSAFTWLFANRLVVRSGITVVMPVIFVLASSFTKHTDDDLRVKQVNLIIRQIGHRLLLQAGDSTSLVLPVTEIREGTFQLQFENAFAFRHDSLIALSQDLFPKTQFPSGYTVTVHDCLNTGIVYGFQVNSMLPDILACKGRNEPSGCYIIEFAFHDFYENVVQKKSELENADYGNVEPKKAADNEMVKQKEADIDQVTGEFNSFKVDAPEANPKLEEFKTTTFDYSSINLVYSGMLVLLGVGLLIGRFGKMLTPRPVLSQEHTIVKGSVPELPALGKFLFDVQGQRLVAIPIAIGTIGTGNEVISLTDKECQILELLNQSFGELIPRETLMQKIWIDEGVITGRSLDMFVSKLRKKLSSDPELRITNVHGKGYKLEMQVQGS